MPKRGARRARAGIGCHADARLGRDWRRRTTAANFNQMPIVRNLRKNTADSPRIWTKSAQGRERVLQALLVGCARMRHIQPTTLKAHHAFPFADGVLAYRHPGVAAERRIPAHAETHGERRRRHAGGEGHCPDACTVGSQAAVAIGHRAQAGAKMLYEYFNEHIGSHDVGAPANAAAGKAVPLPTTRPLQHTLSPADLAPAWRSPQ